MSLKAEALATPNRKGLEEAVVMTSQSVYPNKSKTGPSGESRDYREAWADARNTLAIEALNAAIETFEADCQDPDEFVRIQAAERLRAYREVRDQRLRLLRLQAGQGTARDRERQAWTDLARVVKERVTVPEVLALTGLYLTQTGKEYHSPCPVCRDGVDRLVSWDGPNSRCWCRRCGWRADVIAVVQSLIPDCRDFHDAVTWLADLARTSRGMVE